MIAQNNIRVTGVVVDEENLPVLGASVMEKGTSNGTATNAKGEFSLTLSGKSNTVTITYLGYTTHEFKLNKDQTTPYNIKLAPAAIDLEEAVVVGYGIQKKASVVGAISQVKAEDLQMSSVPNLTNAIAGRVAGVITVMGSGKPGSDDSKLYVRGLGTSNSTDPLVLVDGIERDWKQIDPEDIESFSVLKDASATAVYGVRGANGVILITTKRGVVGKPNLNISVQTAIQQPIRTPKFLDSYNYAFLMNEALRNDGYAPEYSESDLMHYKTGDSPYTHPNNNLYEDFVKDYSLQEIINLNVNGGTDFVKYYISANILHQEGIYKDFSNIDYNTNTNYNRINVRSNLDFQVTKSTTLGVDLTGRLEVRQQPNFGDDLFAKIVRLPPNFSPYINPDGSLGGRSDESRLAPYALITQYGNRNRNKNVLEGVFKINEKMDYITKGLSVRAMAGITSSIESRRDISTKPTLYYYDRSGNYSLNRTYEAISISTGKGPGKREMSFEAAINYNRTFGDHAVTAMTLYQQSQNYDEWKIPTGYLGYVGRATYGFKQRYLFEFNVGYNGSMQFDKDHRYGLFPAVSLGWVVSDESFLRENPVLSYLKIRGSYGEIGNDKIGDFKYLYQQIYQTAPNNQKYQWNWGETTTSSTGNRGLIEGQLGNDKVTWERARKSNIGFDSKFFNNQLSITADYFYEMRNDILAIPYSLPLILGMNKPQSSEREDFQGLPPQNIGKIHNQGIDGEIGFNGKVSDFKYFIKGNFTYAHNIIDRLDEEGKKYDWQKREGKPLGTHFGYTDIGLYQLNDFLTDGSGNLLLEGGFPVLKPGVPVPTMGVVYPGDCRYKDLNEDGIINDDDIGAIGGTNVPEITYGISLGGSYRNFDINILFQGAKNAYMYLESDAVWEFYQQGKVLEHHLGRYNPEDPATWETATYPRLHSANNSNNHIKTSRWLFDRTYLRVKNVEIGYNLPKSVLNKLKLKKIRVYVSGTNLLTFDHVMNWDPENGNISGNQYPQFRLWNFGLNVTF
ncbi:SusC/RagA family TonB-linked outer membrane protein [Bacteroidia bacterium]|nr:SusC/RagA family TonB-linked outer membrane protein [Bacteroidia bacterium]